MFPGLNANLERIGVGYARLSDGMLRAPLGFENATRRRGNWPVCMDRPRVASRK